MGRAQGGQHAATQVATRGSQRRNAASLMYHVAPHFARKDIDAGGLRGDPDEWDEMVWLWDSLAAARAYADTDEDIYCVNVSSLDPEVGGNPPSKEGGLTYAVIGPVSPSLLKRL